MSDTTPTPVTVVTDLPASEETPKPKFFTKNRIMCLAGAATAVAAATALTVFLSKDKDDESSSEETVEYVATEAPSTELPQN
jgi:hypothetical protein